ncbi:MAG: tetratricopeptide repeat protein [Desulfococcaceae bacterium]
MRHARNSLFASFAIFATLFLAGPAWSAGTEPTPSAGDDKRTTANEYFEKGLEYRKAEDWKKSAAQFEKAVEADPDYAEAYSNLGYAYRKQGMFEKAVRTYNKAIELDDELAAAHEYLGEAYVQMGQMDKAREQLDILKKLGAEEEMADLQAFMDGEKEKSW